MSDPASRIAAAPISWGVCEAPDWGVQLPPGRVLDEMVQAGYAGTELGPAGWLAGADLRGLRMVGGFVPVVVHDPATRDAELSALRSHADSMRALGGEVVVLSVVAAREGYDAATAVERPALVEGLRAALGCVADMTVAVHPHVGTLIERPAELDLVLEHTDAGICLDSGHMLAGGIDPIAFLEEHVSRVTHVHLKDVEPGLAAQVRDGELDFSGAVARGLFVNLGEGGAHVGEVIERLERAGYDGWYVVEQDTRVDSDATDTLAQAVANRKFVVEALSEVRA